MANKNGSNIISTIKDYSKRLFGFIRGRVDSDEDAEDVLQDVWYQLSNVVNLDEIERMSGWLHQVARNKIIDRQRKKKPDLLDDYDTDEDGDSLGIKEILLADDYENPETKYLRDIFWKELFAALEELPEAQREVFVWNELEDMTLQQIADKTGQNLKTIISRKGYAVKHLRSRLQTLYNELLTY